MLVRAIYPGIVRAGGSVVDSEAIMQLLAKASIVVYLRAQLSTVDYRISLAPDRGIASPGNHTLEDVYNERAPLDERYANITVDVDADDPEIIAGHITSLLDTL